MAARPQPDKPQVDKFRNLARELETDDDEARFDERLKKLARASPSVKNVPDNHADNGGDDAPKEGGGGA